MSSEVWLIYTNSSTLKKSFPKKILCHMTLSLKVFSSCTPYTIKNKKNA